MTSINNIDASRHIQRTERIQEQQEKHVQNTTQQSDRVSHDFTDLLDKVLNQVKNADNKQEQQFVSELKQQVEDGTYKPDARQIASGIVEAADFGALIKG